MAPDSDPYRTLGLTRDATLDEVRRAYRRLAKANHPDAAGEAALPRFLSIQAAYDAIAGPDARTRRSGAPRPASPRRAWDAERDRTDATYRAYGGRSRRTRPGGAPGSGASAGQGRGTSTGRPAGSRPSAERPPSGRPPRPERPPNKATLGSTSYDGADAEPFEPDWGGASWYGTTSGTYWTLNPKEYADPRKHGPEYQARARRKLAGQGSADERDQAGPAKAAHAAPPEAAPPEAAESPDASPAGAPATAPESPPPPDGTAPGAETVGPTGHRFDGRATGEQPSATHTAASWWEATAGRPPRSETASTRPPGGTPGRRPTGERRGTRTAPYDGSSAWTGEDSPGGGARASGGDAGHARFPDAGPPRLTTDGVLEAIRSWLDDDRPGAIGRVARAVIGWAPIALGIGWVAGEISGCGRFAAGCDETVASSTWLAQIALLVVLLAAGRLARIAAVATLATLAAAIPAALLLSATGNPDDTAAGRLALSGLLVIAWVVGLLSGVAREVRTTGRS